MRVMDRTDKKKPRLASAQHNIQHRASERRDTHEINLPDDVGPPDSQPSSRILGLTNRKRGP